MVLIFIQTLSIRVGIIVFDGLRVKLKQKDIVSYMP